MNIPNMITLLRIMIVPIVVWLITGHYYLEAFWAFLFAGVSDAVDGYLARRWNQRTELGAYLDPLADKALLVSIYISLAVAGIIPHWLAIAVVSRDVMIVGAVMLSWVLERPMAIAPLLISKLNTVAQIGFAALALAVSGYGLHVNGMFTVGVSIVAILTIASTGVYLSAWMKHMASMEMPR